MALFFHPDMEAHTPETAGANVQIAASLKLEQGMRLPNHTDSLSLNRHSAFDEPAQQAIIATMFAVRLVWFDMGCFLEFNRQNKQEYTVIVQ